MRQNCRNHAVKLVHYLSPFGSPAWMPREQAERYLAEDDQLWEKWSAAGMLDERQRAFGPPRIES